MTGLAYRHPRVQRLRRLVSRRSARLAEGSFVVEGIKVLAVALDAGVVVESVYVDPELVHPGDGVEPLLQRCLDAGTRVFDLAEGVLARVADTVSPQPLLAVVSLTDVTLDDLEARHPDLVVVCVDVRDPGNAGAILRAAEAAGAAALVSCGGSVDLFNPKTVRASAGAVFHLPVVAGGAAVEVLDTLGRWGLRRLGTVARAGEDYAAVDLTGPVALVVGNEAKGLPSGLDAHLDAQVTIPMDGRAESINVGMATAVLCFEAARQRRKARAGRDITGPDMTGPDTTGPDMTGPDTTGTGVGGER